MKIQICSDLHLEFHSNRLWLKENPLIPTGDILIIAGDTYHLDKDYSKLHFIKKAANEFEKVFLIPGNHEYYGGYDATSAMETTYQKIKSNVFMVNNKSIMLNGVRFIFSTMWSKINKHFLALMRGLYDFKKIKFGENILSINDFNALHEHCFEFIRKEVEQEGPKVVITHHLPSYECNVREFKDSKLNEGFCVDKTRFIEQKDILYWIYGHSHRNKQSFELNGTQLITNQLGYIGYGEYTSFKHDKIIVIPNE